MCFLFLLCSGCASPEKGNSSQSYERLGGYALDGPELIVVGDLSGRPLRGTIQRKAMVGVGKLKLSSLEETPSLICESVINAQPTEKMRVRGVLDCNDGSVILFTLRPLGPDQGLGIGTAALAPESHASPNLPNSPDSPGPSGSPDSSGSFGSTGSTGLSQPPAIASQVSQKNSTRDLTIFYHPSLEEAERRFPQILTDFTQLRQEKRP